MRRNKTIDDRPREGISKRQLLSRLGILSVAIYVSPVVTLLSQARASPSSGSSTASVPTPPTPPTAPSNIDELESSDRTKDQCRDFASPSSNSAPQISQRDFEQAAASVQAGYAKPLNEFWGDITSAYRGRILSVEFTGFRWRPRYHLRAVSPEGRLETVVVSARTGLVERIVGC